MKKVVSKIIICILIFVMAILMQDVSNASDSTKLSSNYYNIDYDNYIISRIEPETTVEEFKQKIGEYKIYKDKEMTEEVKTGLVGTGMCLEAGDEVYELSVVGDFDGDGKATQVELTNIIRYIVGLQGSELEGILYESADLTGDGLVDQRDITKYIRYIVFGELDLGKGDITGPELSMQVIKQTDSEITVKAIADDKESGMGDNPIYTFYVKKENEPDSAYVKVQSGTDSMLYLTDLKASTTYKIKVETADQTGNKSEASISVETNNIPDGTTAGAIIFSSVTWKNGQAEVTISTNTNYYIEYQVNGTTNTWTTGTVAGESIKVTGLNHNDIVYARLTDKVGHGAYVSIIISDEIAPQLDITTTSGTSEITATINAIDEETGIEESATYIYYIKEAEEPDSSYAQKGETANTTYTFSGLKQNTDYTIKVEIKDKAGNVGTKETSETTQKIPDGTEAGSLIFSNLTWVNGQAEVAINTNTDYYIEYQVNGITEGNWIKASQAGTSIIAENLNHNDVIYARLTDKVASGDYASITIVDTIKPNITLKLEAQNQEITATAQAIDNESGIAEDVTYKFWVKETGTDDSTYVEKQNTTQNTLTIENLIVGKNYTIKVEIEDKAGNKGIIEKSILIPDDIAPIVTLTKIGQTSNIVTLEAGATDEGGLPSPVIYIFYIKETGAADSTYVEKQNSSNKQCTFTGLEQDKDYTVKVEVADIAGNIGIKEMSILTDQIPDATQAGAINFTLITWTNGQAEVEISTNTDYYIEYQVNGTTLNWTTATVAGQSIIAKNLSHNDVIYARLTDGTNTGDYATLTVIDTIKPTVALNATSNKPSEIIAIANAIDNETGVATDATYTFYIKEQGGTYTQKQNTTSKTCTFTGLEQNKDYTIKVEVQDKAGNIGIKETSIKTESIPDGTTAGAIVFSSITWTNEQAEVTISTNTNYYIEYQVNETTLNWTTATVAGGTITVTGLNHNDIIYARLTDKTSSGSYATLTVIDSVKPQSFTISVTDITTTGFTITGSTIDNETGIRDYTYVIEEKGITTSKTKENDENLGGVNVENAIAQTESNNINRVSYNSSNTTNTNRSSYNNTFRRRRINSKSRKSKIRKHEIRSKRRYRNGNNRNTNRRNTTRK